MAHNLPNPDDLLANAKLPQPRLPHLRDPEPASAAPEPAPTPDPDPEPPPIDYPDQIVERGPELVERLRQPGVAYIEDPGPLPNAIEELLGVGVYARDGHGQQGVAIDLDRTLNDFHLRIRQPGRKEQPDRFQDRDISAGIARVESEVRAIREAGITAELPIVAVFSSASIDAGNPDSSRKLESLAEDQQVSVVVVTGGAER